MELWETILKDNPDLFKPVKRNWSLSEVKLAYELVNSYTGKSLVDTGCGSCRRSTITRAIKIADEWRNSSNS
jgi:hypothetical protein